MNSKYYIRLLVILIVSIGLNSLSILVSPFTSPDDLGQLAFIMIIFFPAVSIITGIMSRILKVGILAAPLISAISVALVIFIKYNSVGIKFLLLCSATALAGYCIYWVLELIVKRLRK